MDFTMTPEAMTAAFQAAGYDDVNYSDVMIARRDDDRVWEIVIDKGGRLKASITYPSGRPSETFVPVLDRQAAVLTEKHTIITVMFSLQDTSELPDVLKAVETAVAEGSKRKPRNKRQAQDVQTPAATDDERPATDDERPTS